MELAKLLVESLESHLKAFAAEMDRAKSAEEAAEIVRRAEESWEREPLSFLEGKTLAAYLAELDDVKTWLALVNELAQRELMPVPVRQGVAAKGALLAPYLVELAEHQPEFTALGDAVVDLLGAVGEPARAGLYSLCQRYQHDVESVPYSRAVEILVKLPRQDETWTYLQRGLQEAKGLIGFYAALAGDYGDQRAVLPLNALLEERRDLSEDDRLICLESIELCDGIPSAAGKAAAWSGEPESEWSRVGRNDPCPCGSGLKFKKCHGK